MSQIRKHTFEAVSLLSADNGLLDVTVVPAKNQPDWLVPSSLILSVDDYQERIWTYLWQDQEVAVFHLLPRGHQPDKLVVLEGNTDVHRLALQTAGELDSFTVRIADVKDIELPEQYQVVAADNIEKNRQNKSGNIFRESASQDNNNDALAEQLRENVLISYLFQTVMVNDQIYLVPDLDKIAHNMVDLDS
ncbi:hypothetical protein [Psychrobacter aestuarii]|uniref:Uncharacterized protein n=1 Tax=Psychrobacter aestuarii TaxID=556327 RepID=A0ABN0VTQ5_9GAMM|nr:hypothetical protein [Psychrobacter aestuarii]